MNTMYPSTTRPEERRPTASDALVTIATVVLFLVALSVRSRVVFALVLLALVFVPIEKVWALHPQRVFRKGWGTDVVHFVVNNVLSTIGIVLAVVAVGSVLHAVVPQSVRSNIASQPVWIQAVEALLVAEVLQYWAHRATHSVPWLWRFHKVHHSIQEMDWLAAARLHPVDQAFTRSCFVIPLYALGFSRATFGALLLVFAFQALFIHANVRLTFGPLRYAVATPEFHHWHHAGDPAAYNSNFAGELPLLDKIFGTLYLPKHEWPRSYGVAEEVPDGYLRQLAWPFRVTGHEVQR